MMASPVGCSEWHTYLVMTLIANKLRVMGMTLLDDYLSPRNRAFSTLYEY